MRIFVALLVAPLVAATLLTFVCTPFLELSDSGFLVWFVAFIFLALASFTIGLLLHTAATRTKRTALAYYFAGSVLIGAGLAAWQMDLMLTIFSLRGSLSALPRLGILALGAGVGAAMGTSFWLIRRPDRDASPNPPTSPS